MSSTIGKNAKLRLRASAKINRRYLLIEAPSKESVEKAILEYVGVLGWGKASPFFVSEGKEGEEGEGRNGENRKFVLAVARKEMDNIRAAFELSPEKIKVLRVSGTIKGLGK